MGTAIEFQLNRFIRTTTFLLAIYLVIFVGTSYGQTNDFNKADKELTRLYAKIFPFYYESQDSLKYYSDLFATRFKNFIKDNPSTLNYKFKSLRDSNACYIVTTPDGLFRIYSWDTWLGGSMHDFKNILQFNSKGKIYSTDSSKNGDEFATYFTGIFSLKVKDKRYYLAISGGSESTRDAYETIGVYSISNDSLVDTVKLIKTPSGLSNSIGFEYDFFSVVERPERPTRLIKYDTVKKIIYIPVVLKDGKVTDRFIPYQFTGQYFEKLNTAANKLTQ